MRNVLKYAVFNLVVFVFSLLSAEVGLRVFWKMSPLQGEIYRASSNKTLRYELKPDTRTIYEGHQVSINSAGFRDREYSRGKPKGTYRIIVLGDSVAFGRFNLPEDNLPRRLEKALKARCPSQNFEVLNMGVEGYNTIQEEELLKAKALAYEPDLVIVYYSLNDPDYPEYYFEKNFLNRHSVLARYVQYQVKKHLVRRDRKRKGVKTDEDSINYLYSTDCWRYTREALLRMGDECAWHGARMVLLVFPEMSEQVKDFREGFPFWHIIGMLEGVRHPNILVVTPVREFSRLDLRKDELRNWTYPNLRATDIIVEYLIGELQKQGFGFCG